MTADNLWPVVLAFVGTLLVLALLLGIGWAAGGIVVLVVGVVLSRGSGSEDGLEDDTAPADEVEQ